jgi:hypothetical protein
MWVEKYGIAFCKKETSWKAATLETKELAGKS